MSRNLCTHDGQQAISLYMSGFITKTLHVQLIDIPATDALTLHGGFVPAFAYVANVFKNVTKLG